MPRRARPWYRKSHDMWGFTRSDRFVPLGVRGAENEAAAVAAFEQLMSHQVGPPPVAQDVRSMAVDKPEPIVYVREVCDRFLAAAERRQRRGKLSAKCVKGYREALAPFVAAFGPRPAADLTTEDGADEIEQWAASRGWSSSTRNTYLGVVLSAFKLAGLRTQVRRPRKQSRGATAYIPDDRFALLLADLRARRRGHGPGDLADLLEALRLTGARPQELAPLRAADVDWAAGVVVRDEHKTADKTDEPRLVVLTAAALAVFERQRAKHPTGPLFPTNTGKPYSDRAIVRQLGRASKRLGFRCFAYACRHTFATAALEGGASDAAVAELLGHVDTRMVHTNYKHLSQRTKSLREAAERAGKRAG